MDKFEKEWKRYCDSKGGGAVTISIKDVAKHFAEWQKEQDFNDFARLRKSWYEEGKIDGKFEGLSDDEKYQQGFHDAKAQMMKDAIDAEVYGVQLILQDGMPKGLSDNDKVKVIIIKE